MNERAYSSASDAARALLIAEYEYFGRCFWKNEELGEKRVTTFLTLAAVLATAVAFVLKEGAPLKAGAIPTVVVALFILGLFGRLTFIRIVKRNIDTDRFKKAMALVRRYFVEQDPGHLINYLYFDPDDRVDERKLGIFDFGKGGWLETVAMTNCVIVGVLGFVVLWAVLPTAAAWVAWAASVFLALVLWYLQVKDAKRRYASAMNKSR